MDAFLGHNVTVHRTCVCTGHVFNFVPVKVTYILLKFNAGKKIQTNEKTRLLRILSLKLDSIDKLYSNFRGIDFVLI